MSNNPPTAALEPVTQVELDAMIKKHVKFVQCKPGGARVVLKFRSLVGLYFHEADLSGADFTGSDLRRCNMAMGNYQNTVFYGCNLQGANMSKGNKGGKIPQQ